MGYNISLGQMIPGYNELPGDIKKYVPNFEYVVYDLTKYKDEDVKLESITRIIIKILKDVKYEEMAYEFAAINKCTTCL